MDGYVNNHENLLTNAVINGDVKIGKGSFVESDSVTIGQITIGSWSTVGAGAVIIKNVSDLVHSWLKYPKFAHASATDYSARMVRYGLIKRDEAIKQVKEYDHNLDIKSVRDFCEFCGYTETEFWTIIDSLYNKELFEKNEYDKWVLKHPVWEE